MENLKTPHLCHEPARQVGECVLYRGYGICRICDISPFDFGNGSTDYYVLRSVYDESAVAYVPTDSELVGQMRHVLTKCEVNSVIDRVNDSETNTDDNDTTAGIIDADAAPSNHWIDDGKLRAAAFGRLIESNDRADILWVIIKLCDHRAELATQRKKLYATDEKVLATALRMIKEEFAFVLGIERDAVVPYITDRLGREPTAIPSA